MKAGQSVVYFDASGVRSPATVLAVAGAGPSGYKLLDISLASSGKTITNVPHENDGAARKGFWTLEAVVSPQSTDKPFEERGPVYGSHQKQVRRGT